MMTVEQNLQSCPQEDAPGQFRFRSPVDLSFATFIKNRRKGVSSKDEALPSYAVPADDDVRRTLNLIPFGLRIDDFLERIIQVQIGPVLHNAVRVSPRQFPRLYRVVDHCASCLGIAVPRLMIVPDVRMSAMTVGSSDNHFVMLTSAIVGKCTEAELRFIVGRECGHIQCRHLSYLALARALGEWSLHLIPLAGPLLTQPLRMILQVPLASWQRKAELTCDRAGLLCSKDLDSCLRALAKQTLQAQGLAEDMDLTEYISQLEASSEESTLSKLPEYTQAIPFIPKRMAALQMFARSELYYQMSNLVPTEGLLSREDLEKETDRVTRIL